MQITTRNFVLVMIAVAGLGASVAKGKANHQYPSAAREPAAASIHSVAYFPAQFTLNAPSQPEEHIQAF